MTEERTFDWRPRFDPRSLAFPIRPATAPLPKLNRRTWRRTAVLDQGREGACTGFGMAHVLATTPRPRTYGVDYGFALDIYRRAQQLDEWPGEAYEGSSVLGACKAAAEKGYIYKYTWAFSLVDMQYAVANRGPVEIGVNWYSGMIEPGSDGFIEPTGGIVGGHAISVGGIDPYRGAFLLDNSWGDSWGGKGGARDGSAWLSFESMEQLLHEHGECALVSKHRYVRAS